MMAEFAAKEKLEMDVKKATEGFEAVSVEDEEWTEVEKMDTVEADEVAGAAPTVDENKKEQEEKEAMDVDESKASQKKKAKQDKKRKAPHNPKAYNSSLPSDHESTQKAIQFLQSLFELSQLKADSEADVTRAIQLITQHKLAREHLPTSFLNSKPIWEALLPSMGLTALLRNLGKMTSLELLSPLSDPTNLVCETLRSEHKLTKAKVHPFHVLVALNQYKQGKGHLGSLSWTPTPEILSALNDAFYKSFKTITPTNKRYLLALDVSGSMSASVLGSPTINCRTASAAMAMTIARTEPRSHFVAFQGDIQPFPVNASDSLDTVIDRMYNMPFGATDCALPMLYALEKKIQVDVFILFTDSETWFGSTHPCEALKMYMEKMGIPNARMVVVGMASNEFSIADPEDKGMLDVAGFDSGAPQVISEFVLGKI
jgi:60 kDa SS-A/Ro ribonucleoprotein